MGRISTKKIGEQLKAIRALEAAFKLAEKAGIDSLDRTSDERGIVQLGDCAAEWQSELLAEAQERVLEIFGDVDGTLNPRGARGRVELEGCTRDRIAHTLSAAGWDRDTVAFVFDVVDDSVADGCFLPEPSGAPTVAAPTPADEGEAAAAREGVTFVEPDDASSLMPAGELAPTTGIPVGAPPRPVPVPVHVTLGDASTIVEALELLHDMADAHEDVPSEADAVKRHATALVSKFKAVIARNAGAERPELTDAELKARGLRRLEQGDVMDQVVEVDGHEYMPIDAPCPGCGCKSGEGLTPTCSHPAGCGFWRALEIEPVPTSLLEVAAAVERKTPAEILAARLPGSSVRPVAVIGDGVTVLEITSPAGTDPKTIEAAAEHLATVEATRLIQATEPTSSACKREPWCVLQVGHEGPCLPTMMRDGSF
jgi:hypothetical protein